MEEMLADCPPGKASCTTREEPSEGAATIQGIVPGASGRWSPTKASHRRFRMVARDDLQAAMAAAYLAEHRADRRIAILRDVRPWPGPGRDDQGGAESARPTEAMYDQITPGGADYLDTLADVVTRRRSFEPVGNVRLWLGSRPAQRLASSDL